jgi:hypothetical protein
MIFLYSAPSFVSSLAPWTKTLATTTHSSAMSSTRLSMSAPVQTKPYTFAKSEEIFAEAQTVRLSLFFVSFLHHHRVCLVTPLGRCLSPLEVLMC